MCNCRTKIAGVWGSSLQPPETLAGKVQSLSKLWCQFIENCHYFRQQQYLFYVNCPISIALEIFDLKNGHLLSSSRDRSCMKNRKHAPNCPKLANIAIATRKRKHTPNSKAHQPSFAMLGLLHQYSLSRHPPTIQHFYT